jgi:hypothetical protein
MVLSTEVLCETVVDTVGVGSAVLGSTGVDCETVFDADAAADADADAVVVAAAGGVMLVLEVDVDVDVEPAAADVTIEEIPAAESILEEVCVVLVVADVAGTSTGTANAENWCTNRQTNKQRERERACQSVSQ